MSTKKSYKIPKKYCCDCCDYNTSYLRDYNKHIETNKHKNNANNANTTQNSPTKKYACDFCNKIFNDRSGLWRHKNKCKNIVSSIPTQKMEDGENIKNIDKELIMTLIKDNQDIKNILIEQQNIMMKVIENGAGNSTGNYNNSLNNNNNNNKTFNLQVFLNETCKDAMNINDFVNSIQLQLHDFERMGEVGYAQGISDIITTNLQALDITQRPVHCTDKKRETMYVKHENQWTKDDDNKSKIKQMIKRIENKNIQIIPQFQKKYPNYANPKSHESDKYHKTIIEVMGGMGGSEGKQDKIIRNISKVTTIREKGLTSST